jgi:hypothetical protein
MDVRLTELQKERAADRLIAHQPRSDYPAYSEQYLRQKVARHHECYLEECYCEAEFDAYGCQPYDGLPGMIRVLALLFRLPGELVVDILAYDPLAGLPSSWPDVDELKRARMLSNAR